MNALLYKQLRLVCHPMTPVFCLFGVMVLIPNYPYTVIFFYVMLGLFFTFLNVREQKDIYYSAILPVPKRDTVKAGCVLVALVELLSLAVLGPCALLAVRLQPGKDNLVGMDPNLALFAAGFLLYAVFNAVFLTSFYRSGYKVGVAFIKAREGFRATAYWDYSQYSIGYGSACTKDEYPNGITEAQADILLREMLQGFEKKLDSFLTENSISLSDNQYDALISLSYNIGSGWMKNSALSALLKSGFYSTNELASAMGIWCHVKESGGDYVIHDGLVSRRMAELRVFLYADYSGSSDGFYWVRFVQTEKGDRARDIAFYEAGSTYDPSFDATSDTEVFLGWYTESGELLTDLTATENRTVYAQWESDFYD